MKKWKIVVENDGKIYVVIAHNEASATNVLLVDKINWNRMICSRYISEVDCNIPNQILSEQ